VVRYLTDHGLAKDRMSAVGLSDTRPLINPKDPRSITMNRRVDVVVLTTLPADQAALLPAAAGNDAKLHTGQTTAEANAAAAANAAADPTGTATTGSPTAGSPTTGATTTGTTTTPATHE
jgi:chemotaxis protein MotB